MAKTTKADRELIDQAVKRLKLAVDSDDHNRSAAIEDLQFANGDQWDSREKKRRADKGRPALTINLLPKFIDQVVGDMLHNTPSIKVRPVDSQADVNIAKIRQGIICGIEYQSNSKGIYGYASRQMVTCGYGGWRVLTRYTEDNPFLQEIYLQGIRNPFLMYMDPSSKDQNYADAKWGLLLERVPKDEFEDRYPKATMPSDGFKTGQGLADELWYDGDHVTVAEYFTADTEKQMMFQLDDGRVVTEEEYTDLHDEWKSKRKSVLKKIAAGPEGLDSESPPTEPSQEPQPPTEPQALPSPPTEPPAPQQPAGAPPTMGMAPGQMPPQPPTGPPAALPNDVAPLLDEIDQMGVEPKIVKKRETDKTTIRHWIITCMEILEGGKDGNIFPGRYVPLVLLKGKELNIEGKNYVYSLIRHAKDVVKMNNYWNSCAAEVIALAPKAPWVGTAKQFEGYENDYAAANVENFPFLKYTADPEAQGMPQRQGPGQPPTAIFEQIRRGEENLKSVIGLFNADVGAPGSEQTGAAIIARQKPGDVGTFEFSENLARAVMFTGKIINEMIPSIYDTERDVRIRNIDEAESFVPVNTTVDSAMKSIKENPERFAGLNVAKLRTIFSKEGKDAKYNDITVGKYDIAVEVGPSYSTQRQESAQQLLMLVQAMPQQMANAADLIVENLDFKEAQELAARLRKSLPPGLAKPRPGEAPAPDPPPSPEVQLAQIMMETEKGKQEFQKLKIQEETVKGESEKTKANLEIAKLQADLQKTQMGNEAKDEIAKLKLALEEKKHELSIAKFQLEQKVSGIKLTHKKIKIDGDMAFKNAEFARDNATI